MTDTIIIYATTWCPDCRRAHKFLDDHGIPHEYVDIDKNPEGSAYVKQVNHGNRSVPTILFPDGSILVEPRDDQLAEKLGVNLQTTRG
jgi:glutaredoxin-like protein